VGFFAPQSSLSLLHLEFKILAPTTGCSVLCSLLPSPLTYENDRNHGQ
jgi:hypothetical protein